MKLPAAPAGGASRRRSGRPEPPNGLLTGCSEQTIVTALKSQHAEEWSQSALPDSPVTPQALSPLLALLLPRAAQGIISGRKDSQPVWEEYVFADTVETALGLLARHQGKAQLIAGGTDLFLQSQRGQCPATVMVDITRIPGLGTISEKDGYIHIGALATHAQVAASPLIREKAAVLAMACSRVGGPQTRNAGTLVGNVVNAQPAADGATALFALDAELEIAAADGTRWEPISSLYRGVGKSAIDPRRDMVTQVRFRSPGAGWGSGYQRLAKRRALTLPVLVVAAALQIEGDQIRQARIAVGPVAPTPFRASDAEGWLVGKAPSDEVFTQAGQLAAAKAQPRESALRGSTEYRRAMVAVLVRRALAQALESCQGRR